MLARNYIVYTLVRIRTPVLYFSSIFDEKPIKEIAHRNV